MNLCPCLSKSEMPALLIKAKQLRLETSTPVHVVKECHTGKREDLNCAVNSAQCENYADGHLLNKRKLFKLI